MSTKLELIKSGDNSFKIISKSSNRHPLLKELAIQLKEFNKVSDHKVGLYNVLYKPFKQFVGVYSYISGNYERLNKTKYDKFLKGKYHLKANKAKKSQNSQNSHIIKEAKTDEEVFEGLGFV